MLATENLPLSTHKLAVLMRDRLHCYNAINLDGGNSTQLFAQISYREFNITSFSSVADAVLVIPKNSQQDLEQ